MAHSRESRQAAKRLTACSSLRHVTTATRPSITPRSDGLTHAFCQGAEPQRWSLFNLHADTLPFPLSRSFTSTHTRKHGRLRMCTNTCTPAATIRHEHIYMYATAQENTGLPFSANDTANTSRVAVGSVFIVSSQIRRMTEKLGNNLCDILKPPRALAQVTLWKRFGEICTFSGATGTLKGWKQRPATNETA